MQGNPPNVSSVMPAAPSLSDGEFELFRKLMHDTTGINLSPAKRALVAGRLSKRVRELGFASYRDYFTWVTSNSRDPAAVAERQTTIDLLTTNETYFFREPRHFEFLMQDILPQWRGKRVRMWSAACSSGEEAYTLAMIMTLHGPSGWEVVGTDVSSRVLQSASKGVYPLERTKHIPEEYLKQCCLKGVGSKAGTFMIDAPLRQKVNFRYGNLMEDQAGLGQFELIMLRNVLIYFDREGKQRVVRNVLKRLKPGGWLMVGHAESLNGVTDAVRTIKPSIYQLAESVP